MKFLTFIVSFFCFVPFYYSQLNQQQKIKIDSLTLKLAQDSLYNYRFKKIRLYANINSNNSFNVTNLTNLSGFQFGAIVNEYHTFGVGLYTLSKFSKNNSPLNAIYKINKFGYINIFYEYFLLNKRFLEIALPFEIGVGGFQGQLQDTLSARLNISKLFMPLGAGVKLIIKPIKWLGVSSMIGYRYIPYKQNLLDYDGLYYSLGIWVNFRQIYRDIKYYGFQKKRYKKEVNFILLN